MIAYIFIIFGFFSSNIFATNTLDLSTISVESYVEEFAGQRVCVLTNSLYGSPGTIFYIVVSEEKREQQTLAQFRNESKAREALKKLEDRGYCIGLIDF